MLVYLPKGSMKDLLLFLAIIGSILAVTVNDIREKHAKSRLEEGCDFGFSKTENQKWNILP